MKLKGSKTEEILRGAFASELQTNASYVYLASAAREAGFEEIADMLLATAKNEAEHARHEFEFLGGAGDTKTNLQLAISREHEQATKFYPEAAEVAEREGFTDIAEFFRKMHKVEEKHEKNFLALLETLNGDNTFKGRTVGHSAVEMAQVMLPPQANPAGFVHGGELMKLMDNAAGVVAARHSRANIVTAKVDNITFRNPVRVGSLVIIRGKITFTSHSSMEVQIEVETEDLRDGSKLPALTAYFIMVALDIEGKPAEVPPLILNTEEEEQLYSKALARYKARKS
ncbi:MAG: ferritin family protein [Dehalococcoidales bacterium]|nr:ferritin family protein [Dehalococcoidales bacterium]